MKQTKCNLKVSLIVLLLFVICTRSLAQLPQCDRIYCDKYLVFFGLLLSTQEIYEYNPALPISATNPSLNSISLPADNYGLTIGEVLGSGSPTLTFYTILQNTVNPALLEYWYYNPATSAWVNTNHTAGDGAVNIAAGGSYIYALNGTTGDVYQYNGTGNATLLTNVPGFSPNSGLFDLIADCAGNWYVLQPNATAPATTFMRKYDPSGALVQSWTVSNPNGYTPSAGFGIIGTDLYMDNTVFDPLTFSPVSVSIASGIINPTNVALNASTPPMASAYPANFLIGDLGSCSSGVPVLPMITITPSSTQVCEGDTVNFTSTVSDAGTNPQYQWRVNGVAIAGATGSTFSYIPNDGDVVTCDMTGNAPCATAGTANSNAVTLQVADGAPPTLSYASTVWCRNGSAAPAYTPAGGTFSVSPAGALVDATTGVINLAASATGTYTITYTTAAGAACPMATAQFNLTIANAPQADITMATNEPVCLNNTLLLSTPQGAGYSYEWTPVEYFAPNANKTATVTATLFAPGTIRVKVVNGEGCMAFDSIRVNPIACCSVFMPNSFTPNGDGLNDVFKIESQASLAINQFTIFNRWGQQVFSSDNRNRGWDGTYHQKPADPGTYRYYLLYTCDGVLKEKKGEIHLIR